MKIYGLTLIWNSFTNWFLSGYNIIIFIIGLLILCYFFYKINIKVKVNGIFLSSASHYFFNLLLIIGFFSLVYIGKFTIEKYFLSYVYTGIFYSVSIFTLTLFLIFLRRYKIKKLIISLFHDIRNDNIKEIKKAYEKIHGNRFEHKYLEMVYEDLSQFLYLKTKNEKYLENIHACKNVKNKVISRKPFKSRFYLKNKFIFNFKKYEDINIFKDKNMA